MNVLRHETPLNRLGHFASPRIFLAGPTVRGHQSHLQPSWRYAAIKEFDKRGFEGSLIVPEFADITVSDKGRCDLPIWEYEGLKIADCILFWVPRTRELIGLTTNFELGYWMRWREKVLYGRPDNAYRIDYLDILWKKDYEEHNVGSAKIHNYLSDIIADALKLAGA